MLISASVLIWLALATTAFASAPPLLSFDFETNLVNRGSLGGQGRFHTYAPHEDPLFGFGPFGHSLDLTAAARHGGLSPQDQPSGGGVIFHDSALDSLESFTLLLWMRQNPLVQGESARLLQKINAWDLMAHPSGLSLALGPGASKVNYTFRGRDRLDLCANWCFVAVTVAPQMICAYTGNRQQPLTFIGSEERRDSFKAAAGDLILGNFSGIRPFNGWLDQLRIYRGALDEPALRSVFNADLAAGRETAVASVVELGRLPSTNHAFHLPASAIPFSTRWQRRTNAFEVMESFHATHCLWVYGSETNFINSVKRSGRFYQGTLNGLQGQSHATTNTIARGDASGRHEDLDGNKNTPRWMVTFGPRTFTGCCNHPAFRKLFFADAQHLVASGVDSIHVDDWEMNASWVRNAGLCFCETCRRGFREWLALRYSSAELKELGIDDLKSFDYRLHLKANGVPDAATYRQMYCELPLTPQFADFQIDSMRNFYKEFRRKLDACSPDKYIPVSVNGLLAPLRSDRVLYGVDIVDFLHGESSQIVANQSARQYIFGAKAAEAAGITQVISPIPRSTARTRAAIATTYALGQPHLVPWDLYMGSDESGSQPRYFGSREQYGDLYDFIDKQRNLLDKFVSIAEVGILVNGDQPCDNLQPLCQKLARQQIPYHIILGASRYARVSVRAEDLKKLRLLIMFSPVESFCAEDQAVLQSAQAKSLLRFVPASVDLIARIQSMEADVLRLEGPENLYLFPRSNCADHALAIHVVNWNLTPAPESMETYCYVTVSLLKPQRWDNINRVLWHEPGQEAVVITPERHAGSIRLTLPQITTWGIIEIR